MKESLVITIREFRRTIAAKLDRIERTGEPLSLGASRYPPRAVVVRPDVWERAQAALEREQRNEQDDLAQTG